MRMEFITFGLNIIVYGDTKKNMKDFANPDSYKGKTPLEMTRQFATVMKQQIDADWYANGDLEQMRLRLITEEYNEIMQSEDTDNLIKELADLIYVTYGYAACFGWDLDEAVRRVHASNMSKLGEDGEPIYRHDGKVLKGPNYMPPDLSDLT